jgi:hypothetical protein
VSVERRVLWSSEADAIVEIVEMLDERTLDERTSARR